MRMNRNLRDGLIALLAPSALSTVVWFAWYPAVGYGTVSRVAAQLAYFAAAALLIAALRLRWRDAGLGPRRLAWAVMAAVVAYGVVMLAAWLSNAATGTGYAVLRSTYRLWPLVDAFLLTALGEELLFAGVAYRVLRRGMERVRPVWSVVITAVAFAGMHLPGYLAMDYPTSQVLGRLGVNFVSWLVFGAVYAASGNLWSTVVAHAATDHGLTPLVTAEPLFGLAFMAVMVAMASLERRSGAGRRLEARAGPLPESVRPSRTGAGSASPG